MNASPSDRLQGNAAPASSESASHHGQSDPGKSQGAPVNLDVRLPDWLSKRVQLSAPLWAVGLGLLLLALIALD